MTLMRTRLNNKVKRMEFLLINKFVILLLCIGSIVADIADCDYFDTVDLTESTKFPNGSYLYESLVIPPELTGEYDYQILVDGERVGVTKHVRGCACKLGTCLRFCCHENLVLVEGERKCSGDISKALDFDPYVSITLDNGTEVVRHILDKFIVQRHLPVPCSAHFHLGISNDYNYTLYEDGNLVTHFDQQTLSKQEYCLQPHPINDEDGREEILLVPHLCQDPIPNQWPVSIVIVFTNICLLLTIIVYLALKKLRNLHGYCFVCYLLCLLIAYTLILSDKWSWVSSELTCLANGYVGYFAVMAGFLWLTVISFDLWNSFRGNNLTLQRHTPRNRFKIYSLYAWGMALLLTTIVIIIDHVLDSNEKSKLPWMPGVGIYNCWIKTDDWSAMIYFYGPMSLQIIFNVTMFILTAKRIFVVMKELQSIVTRQERQQRIKSDKQTYSLFTRLFVIMGVTWTFEIFSYLSISHGVYEKIFLFFDYINCAQGIIIFVMFVLKRSVLRLISDWIFPRQRPQSHAMRSRSLNQGSVSSCSTKALDNCSWK